MKNKELLHRIFIMVSMIFLLVVATVAWFINNVTPSADPAEFAPGAINISAYLQEVDAGGVPINPQGEHGIPFDINGMVPIVVDNLVPGQAKIFRITIVNGESATHSKLSLSNIDTQYTVVENDVEVIKISEIDKHILFKAQKQAEDGIPDTSFADGAPSIFTQRNGSTDVLGIDFEINPNDTAYYYGIFKFNPQSEAFAEGSMQLNFEIAGALKQG